MPSFTKKAIVDSFMALASKKPLEKITVRDIVDDCGINRNTFYYHFQDIYAVLEYLCGTVMDGLPEDALLTQTVAALFRRLQELQDRYPKAVKCLLMSLGYEGLERYFAPTLDRLIEACLIREAALVGDRLLHTTVFVRRAVFGYCAEALQSAKGEKWQHADADLSFLLDSLMASLSRGRRVGQ